jgi:lipoprotein-anchoring transpeptidase ErfK/SrfK
MQGIARLMLRGMLVRGAAHLTIVGLLATSPVGCTSIKNPTNSGSQWLDSGSLALSRPVPTQGMPTKLHAAGLDSSTGAEREVARIVVSRNDRTITALRPGIPPIIVKAEGAQRLPTGSFSVTIKEENPLWYAPAEYFSKRSLQIPQEGSRARFMRAALGNRALYLNNQAPIHSGPVWLDEIGGIRVKQPDMEQLYSMIAVGTRVEVR